MKKISHDKDLKIEICSFKGITQPFLNHFHNYYVIGSILEGERNLVCNNKNYAIKKEDIILFNPNDSHSCTQSSNKPLNYLGFNIEKEVMLNLSFEITGIKELPHFSKNVIFDDELNFYISLLHKLYF